MRGPVQVAAAAGAAALGGLCLSALGFPVAWLVGAMLGMAAYNQFSPAPYKPPRLVRRLGEWVLGAGVGANLTAEVAGFLAARGVPILVVLVGGIATGVVSGFILLRSSGLAAGTCFYSAVPGGAAEMVALADATGADARLVASLHAVRVALLVATLPLAFSPLARSGGAGALRPLAPAGGMSVIVLILAAGAAGGWLFYRLRLPGGVILGAMVGGALAALAGLTGGAGLPGAFKACAQAVIGASAGAQFTRDTWGALGRVLRPALGMIAFMVATGLASGVFLHFAAGLDWITAMLATVPAGSAEMIGTAAALGADAGVVAAIQVLRVLTMNLVFPVLVPRLVSRTAY